MPTLSLRPRPSMPPRASVDHRASIGASSLRMNRRPCPVLANEMNYKRRVIRVDASAFGIRPLQGRSYLRRLSLARRVDLLESVRNVRSWR